jgi:hypothetical protein
VNGYTLEFLDTATGASVQVGCDDSLFSHDEDGEFDDFWWSEGNGSCDCNRNLFWNDKTGECGDMIRLNIIDPGGRVIYREFKP